MSFFLKMFGKKEKSVELPSEEIKPVISKDAEYVMILFASPGPKNEKDVVNKLLPMVMQNSDLSIGEKTKIQTITEPLSNATDMIPIETRLLAWLSSEGIQDISKKYEIRRMGLNANQPTYKFALVGYAIPIK